MTDRDSLSDFTGPAIPARSPLSLEAETALAISAIALEHIVPGGCWDFPFGEPKGCPGCLALRLIRTARGEPR